MIFDRQSWFARLNKKLNDIGCSDGLEFYLVNAGPVSFNIALQKNSLYKKSLQAFYAVKPAHKVDLNNFTVYCLDCAFSDRLPGLSIDIASIRDAQNRNKVSTEKQLLIYDVDRGIIKAIDLVRRAGILYTADFLELPSWEYYSPLKEFVHFLALESDSWLAHAGSLASNGVGTLLVGPGGAGKSTTTISALQHGMNTAGDDYVIASLQGERCMVYSLYRTMKSHANGPLGMPKLFMNYSTEIDPLTNKTIYFCNKVDTTGPLISSFELKKITGLKLRNWHNRQAEESRVEARLGYNHFAMSSIGQMPFWVDKSMTISGKVFKSVSNEMKEILMGIDGMRSTTLSLIRELQS